MKKNLLILLLSFTAIVSHAQLKHYFSVNSVLYGDFFNKEQDKVSSLKALLATPCLSYKIEWKKWGIETYFSHTSSFYNKMEYGSINPGDIEGLFFWTIGLNTHYTVYESKFIKINPMIGLSYNYYYENYLIAWLGNPPMYEPVPGGGTERKIGLQAGVNINVPVFKGIYTNSNIRYSALPWAQYNKQNLLIEIGLGYRLQRKK